MKKIFIDQSNLSLKEKINIIGDDYHHMANVLRVKINEEFIIGDTNNNEFKGKIISIDSNKITLELYEEFIRIKSSVPEITLIFSLLKGDKNEFIIQKCSEIGVNYFIPVITKNSIIKLNINEAQKKINKWNKIIKETGMQAMLHKLPIISEIKKFDELKNIKIIGIKSFCNIHEKQKKLIDLLKSNIEKKPMAFFIGPEGDFDKNEIKSLKDWGWESINLSQNILKSETSAIFTAASVFSFFYNNNL